MIYDEELLELATSLELALSEAIARHVGPPGLLYSIETANAAYRDHSSCANADEVASAQWKDVPSAGRWH